MKGCTSPNEWNEGGFPTKQSGESRRKLSKFKMNLVQMEWREALFQDRQLEGT